MLILMSKKSEEKSAISQCQSQINRFPSFFEFQIEIVEKVFFIELNHNHYHHHLSRHRRLWSSSIFTMCANTNK